MGGCNKVKAKLRDEDGPSPRSSVRVRDNQRRARERHKAYVQDLERKVRDYEQQGVQATLEMQRAARSVAVENFRLRELLQRRGVEYYADIEQFLKSFSEASNVEISDHVESQTELSTHTSPCPLAGSPAVQEFEQERVNETAIGGKECCEGKTTCSFPSDGSRTGSLTHSLSLKPATSDALTTISQTSGSSTPLSYDSATTMSCSAAAKIIADMQGHGDVKRARTTLGCGQKDECAIKNTALFEILEG